MNIAISPIGPAAYFQKAGNGSKYEKKLRPRPQPAASGKINIKNLGKKIERIQAAIPNMSNNGFPDISRPVPTMKGRIAY